MQNYVTILPSPENLFCESKLMGPNACGEVRLTFLYFKECDSGLQCVHETLGSQDYLSSYSYCVDLGFSLTASSEGWQIWGSMAWSLYHLIQARHFCQYHSPS